MEKQLEQLMDNVKAYCKRILMLVVSASFACAALITANGEAAKNVLPFKQVALSECTQEDQNYVFGDIKHDDYHMIQNHLLVEEALLAAASVEPEVAGVEEKTTDVVAQSNQINGVTVSPVYADPSMNGYECLGTFLTTMYKMLWQDQWCDRLWCHCNGKPYHRRRYQCAAIWYTGGDQWKSIYSRRSGRCNPGKSD